MKKPLLAILVITLLATGILYISTGNCASTQATGDAPPATTLPILGKFPAWQLKDLDGKTIKSSDFAGKYLLIDFWATWCPPCRAEIPGYIELSKKYAPHNLVLIGISLDQSGASTVKTFAQKNNINYLLLMSDSNLPSSLNIQAIPTTYLIDPEGNIRDIKTGALPKSQYEPRIRQLLRLPPEK